MAFRLFPQFSGTVPVIRLSGAIGISSPLQPGLSLATLAPTIDKAFETKRARAVALQINSPGGSPVQSALIATRIRALAEEKKIPVYAFVEDVAASGGYWLACAADEIYADYSSIIGSIGVVSASFGFVEAIEKLGIERRVFTAGKNKVSLDPFLPSKEDDIARLKKIQLEIHENFINMVLNRRGDRLNNTAEDLFTGEFWTGNKAVEFGLIDGLSDIKSKMQEIYGKKVGLTLVQPKKGLFSRTGQPGVEQLSSQNAFNGLAEAALQAGEVRALWARYGL